MINRRIINPPCPKHPKEQLMHICIHPSCDSQTLICFKCSKEDHKDHPTKSVIEFAQDFDNARYSQSMMNYFTYVKDIIKSNRTEFVESMGRLKQKVIGRIDQIQNRGKEYYDNILMKHKQMYDQSTGIQIRPFQIRLDGSYGSLENMIKEQKALFFQRQSKEADFYEKVEEMERSLSVEKGELVTVTFKVEKCVMDQLKLLSALFLNQKEISFLRKPMEWSTTLKHPNLIVDGLRLSGSITRPAGCLSTRELSEIPDTWSIRIAQMKGWIGLGICQAQQVIAHNFSVWNWPSKLGHGLYIIDSAGRTYSSLEPTMNGPQKGYELKAGDLIKIQFSPSLRIISFSKGTQKVQMKIQDNKRYRACAFLRDECKLELISI